MTIPHVKWKMHELKHWFSQETIHLIQQKRHLYLHIKPLPHPSLSLLSKYRALSNKVCGLTRRDMKLYTDKVVMIVTRTRKKLGLEE